MITRVLRNRFIFAPSLLSSAIKPFDGLENRFAFYKLVKEYDLPEADNVKKFAELFSKKYFPINAGYYSADMKDLVKGIPARFYGMSKSEYDGYNIPGAQLLASALCVSPVSGGARIVVMEKFAKQGGEPLDGWLPDDVVEALAGKFPGLVDWCRWIFNATGNLWLDKTDILPWGRKTVDQLTKDRPLYLEIYKRMTEFNTWLGKDFKKRCAEVIKYAKANIKEKVRIRV